LLISCTAHKGDKNNEQVDSICTAAILANDVTPRYEGPQKLETSLQKTTLHSLGKHFPLTLTLTLTLPPYRPFMENETSPRGFDDR
jgi:hypothetical protein